MKLRKYGEETLSKDTKVALLALVISILSFVANLILFLAK